MSHERQVNMKRSARIQSVSAAVGWAYSEMKWVTGKGERAANRERDGLIRSLSGSKGASFSFAGSKIHIGPLSPGCLICGQGYWSCMFVNRKCPGTCFFCPVDTKMKKDLPPLEGSEFTIADTASYIKFLKKYDFRGVGISGGEPFLVFDRSLSFVRDIKKSFGDKMYVWMYTNGILATEEKLKKLKKAGLNELRFNIAARKYDLRPVEIAARIIPTVTVEIPSIPEDHDILKRTLPVLKRIGVKHLNLHILTVHPRNYRDYVNRGYTFVHSMDPTVLESEISALKLLNYALEKKIGLPINYCTDTYKQRFQQKGDRRWANPLIKEGFEELTDTNFIRRLTIRDSRQNIGNLVNTLKKLKIKRDLWAVGDAMTDVHIHSSLLRLPQLRKHNVIVSYLNFSFSGGSLPGKKSKEVQAYSKNKFFNTEILAYQERPLSPALIQGFLRLYLQKENESDVFKELYLKSNASMDQWREGVVSLLRCMEFERTPQGFEDIC